MKRLSRGAVWKLRLAYFLPMVPMVPVMGDPQEADCLWVQAFSRKSIAEKRLADVLAPLFQEAAGSEPEVFRRLILRGFDPGDANRRLARLAREIAERYAKGAFPLAIVGQWEVVFCLYEEYREWYDCHRDRIHAVFPPHVGPTPRVKARCIEISQAHGLVAPIELAVPVMLARAVAHIWGLGWNCIVVPFDMSLHETFVPGAAEGQEHTERFIGVLPWKGWLAREVFGRLIYMPVIRYFRKNNLFALSPP